MSLKTEYIKRKLPLSDTAIALSLFRKLKKASVVVPLEFMYVTRANVSLSSYFKVSYDAFKKNLADLVSKTTRQADLVELVKSFDPDRTDGEVEKMVNSFVQWNGRQQLAKLAGSKLSPFKEKFSPDVNAVVEGLSAYIRIQYELRVSQDVDSFLGTVDGEISANTITAPMINYVRSAIRAISASTTLPGDYVYHSVFDQEPDKLFEVKHGFPTHYTFDDDLEFDFATILLLLDHLALTNRFGGRSNKQMGIGSLSIESIMNNLDYIKIDSSDDMPLTLPKDFFSKINTKGLRTILNVCLLTAMSNPSSKMREIMPELVDPNREVVAGQRLQLVFAGTTLEIFRSIVVDFFTTLYDLVHGVVELVDGSSSPTGFYSYSLVTSYLEWGGDLTDEARYKFATMLLERIKRNGMSTTDLGGARLTAIYASTTGLDTSLPSGVAYPGGEFYRVRKMPWSVDPDGGWYKPLAISGKEPSLELPDTFMPWTVWPGRAGVVTTRNTHAVDGSVTTVIAPNPGESVVGLLGDPMFTDLTAFLRVETYVESPTNVAEYEIRSQQDVLLGQNWARLEHFDSHEDLIRELDVALTPANKKIAETKFPNMPANLVISTDVMSVYKLTDYSGFGMELDFLVESAGFMLGKRIVSSNKYRIIRSQNDLVVDTSKLYLTSASNNSPKKSEFKEDGVMDEGEKEKESQEVETKTEDTEETENSSKRKKRR